MRITALLSIVLLSSCSWVGRNTEDFMDWADRTMPTYDDKPSQAEAQPRRNPGQAGAVGYSQPGMPPMVMDEYGVPQPPPPPIDSGMGYPQQAPAQPMGYYQQQAPAQPMGYSPQPDDEFGYNQQMQTQQQQQMQPQMQPAMQPQPMPLPGQLRPHTFTSNQEYLHPEPPAEDDFPPEYGHINSSGKKVKVQYMERPGMENPMENPYDPGMPAAQQMPR